MVPANQQSNTNGTAVNDIRQHMSFVSSWCLETVYFHYLICHRQTATYWLYWLHEFINAYWLKMNDHYCISLLFWRIISGYCVETDGTESEHIGVLLRHVPQSGGLWKSRSFQQAKAWVKHDGEARWHQFRMTAHFEIHTAQQAWQQNSLTWPHHSASYGTPFFFLIEL